MKRMLILDRSPDHFARLGPSAPGKTLPAIVELNTATTAVTGHPDAYATAVVSSGDTLMPKREN